MVLSASQGGKRLGLADAGFGVWLGVWFGTWLGLVETDT